MVYQTVARFVVRHEDREDIIQEVFLNVWHALPTLQPESNLSGWLQVIARNKSIDWLRKKHLFCVPLEVIAETSPAFIDGQAQNPVVCYELRERLRQLCQLSPQEQYYFAQLAQGYLITEIAAQVGLRANTVKTRIARARARMQREERRQSLEQNKHEGR